MNRIEILAIIHSSLQRRASLLYLHLLTAQLNGVHSYKPPYPTTAVGKLKTKNRDFQLGLCHFASGNWLCRFRCIVDGCYYGQCSFRYDWEWSNLWNYICVCLTCVIEGRKSPKSSSTTLLGDNASLLLLDNIESTNSTNNATSSFSISEALESFAKKHTGLNKKKSSFF